MKYIKETLFLIMLLMTISNCKSSTTNNTILYSQKQVDSIVALELQNQFYAVTDKDVSQQINQELIELKLEKIVNDKFVTYLSQHDGQITQHITILGLFFTLLCTIVGIFIPLMNNRRIESKLNEHTRKLVESKKELEQSEKELEQSKQEFATLKQNIESIRDEVTNLKQETYNSKIEAEKAARQSKFSELLSRAWNENEVDKKMEMFSKLIEDYPENEFSSQSHYARGVFYFDCKKYDNAIDDFTVSLDLDSNNADAYFYRGYAFEQNGVKDNAISDYSNAISINPNHTEALYRRGNITMSIKDLEKAIAISPNYIKAYFVLGSIYDGKDNNLALDYYAEGKRRARFEGDLQMINQFEKVITRLRGKMQ